MSSKLRYEVIIYWSDEGQAFSAEVFELPGCAADGKAYAAVVVDAVSAASGRAPGDARARCRDSCQGRRNTPFYLVPNR